MANKAIFLDRDGTLIEDPGYISSPDQVRLLDGVAEAIIEFKSMGYKLVVVSNQSGVARGIVTEKALAEIHDRLKQLLIEKKTYLDRIYYCPYHPEATIPKYRKDQNNRKPNPGMLLTAADEMDIDLNQSWMIGDDARDIEAGLRAGCKTILISQLPGEQLEADEPRPDYKAVNIKEAVNIVKKHHRSSQQQTGQPPSTSEPQSQPISQVIEKPKQPETTRPLANVPEQKAFGNRTEQLLIGILEQLKAMQRSNMFGEFSMMRLMAGIIQGIVLFCLLICIYFLLSPSGDVNSVLISLGFAVLLQLMALTFYVMQGRK